MYNMFVFPLCSNISIIQTKLCFRCHIFFFKAKHLSFSTGLPSRHMMERRSDILWSSLRVAVVLGFSTALHRSKSMVTLDAVRWLVGEEDGGSVLVVEPQPFFLFGGGNVELYIKYIKLSSEHLAFFLLSEWKFVQYGCRVGYFARDSMKTE